MRLLILLPLLLLACSSTGSQTEDPADSPEITSQASSVPESPEGQLIVVITPDWDSPEGVLRTYTGQAGAWEQQGTDIPVLIGKKGLGWARRAPEQEDAPGPLKVEGDLKSPAGQFELGPAFGYAQTAPAGTQWAYVPVDSETMCIEDVDSRSYNQIIDARTTPKDYSSTDRMRRDDDLYEWGLWVYHNFPEPEPRAGSCIFLHVWRAGGSGTAGCTSMAKGQMQELIRWLKPSASPKLVQMPLAAYTAIQRREGHPAW